MVYAQQMEGNRLRKKSQEAKKAKSYEGGFCKGRLDIQDKTMFKKRYSIQVLTKFPKARDDMESNHMSQNGRDTSSPTKNQLVENVARNIMVIA